MLIFAFKTCAGIIIGIHVYMCTCVQAFEITKLYDMILIKVKRRMKYIGSSMLLSHSQLSSAQKREMMLLYGSQRKMKTNL